MHFQLHFLLALQLVCVNSMAGAAPGGSEGDAKASQLGAEVVLSPLEQQIAAACKALTMLFPLWTILAAVAGLYYPAAFAWYVYGQLHGRHFDASGGATSVTLFAGLPTNGSLRG